jgi:branched-chain amino acid transport system substrate-binding protein
MTVKNAAIAAAALGASAWLAAPAVAGETKGPVTDDFGVVKINANDPVIIGTCLAIGGPESALGIDEKRTIETAFDEVDWNIASHSIKLTVEDSACNSEDGQNAATKLAANQKVLIVIGPSRSNTAMPGAPILGKAGIPSIRLNSVLAITAPDSSDDYNWYVRAAFNDSWSALADADYAFNVERAKTASLLHDDTAYSQSVAEYFGRAFEAQGGKVLSIEAAGAQDVDMRPALTRIAADAPDLLYMPLYVFAAGYVVRQPPEISGLEKTTLLGQNALMIPNMIMTAGKAVKGFKIALVDVSESAFGGAYPSFIETYTAKYSERPPQAAHYLAYDATLLAIAAIEDVAVTDDAGNTYVGRDALRDRVYATKSLQGLSGEINCNEYGACGVFNGPIYEFVDGDPATFEAGKNPVRVFPASNLMDYSG